MYVKTKEKELHDQTSILSILYAKYFFVYPAELQEHARPAGQTDNRHVYTAR